MERFMQKLLEADKGDGQGGGNSTTPPTQPSTDAPQGAGNGSTPPGSGGQGETPKAPDKGGQADNKPKGGVNASPFAGLHPNRVASIKRQLTEELTPAIMARIQEDADVKAGKLESKLTRLEQENPTLKARVEELEGQLESYRSMASKHLDERIKDWPKEWLDGDPRKRNPDASLEDVTAWADWAEPLVKKVVATPPAPGNPGNPASNGHNPALTPAMAQAYEAKVRAEKGIDL